MLQLIEYKKCLAFYLRQEPLFFVQGATSWQSPGRDTSNAACFQ